MIELPEIAVFTDTGELGQQALAAMRAAAGQRAGKVVERKLSDIPREQAAALGLRALPAIVFNGMVALAGVPTAKEAEGLLQRAEIDRVILRYAIPGSTAIRDFADGKSPDGAPNGAAGEATARAIASQFFPFSEEFPLFLSAAISHVRDEPGRMLLVHNLYEEHGNLSGPDRLHPALFRAFCRGVGLKSDSLEHQGIHAPGVQAADMVMEICRKGPAHRAIAALYPIELMFGPTCDIVIRGLKHLHLSYDAMDYWFIHSSSGVELEHAEQMRQALLRCCRTSAEWEEAIGVAEDVAQMFFELFDHIARADIPSAQDHQDIYEAVRGLCADMPAVTHHPLGKHDATYYTAITVGQPGHWFLRSLGDAERKSLVTRLSVERARALAPGFTVEPAPRVFGHSRIFYKGQHDFPHLKGMVREACAEAARGLG